MCFACLLFITHLFIVQIFGHNMRLDWSNDWMTVFSDIKNTINHIFNRQGVVSTNKAVTFSKFKCTGDENNINAWYDRLCVFYNICYNVQMQHFEYYRPFRIPTLPLFYDSTLGMLSEFKTGENDYGFLSLTSRGGQPWAPVVVDHANPSTNVKWLINMHTLWKERFEDNNFGHIVWEDIGSIFYSLERMNEFDKQLVVMHVTPISMDQSFQKFTKDILPAITSKSLVEYKSYLAGFNTKYVCFQRFIVGGNLQLIHHTALKENHGRESLFYRWRSRIIAYHKLDPEYIPKRHRIVVTNKSASIWAKTSSGTHRAIANLDEVVRFVRNKYPKISIDVIEWHKVTFVEQIQILLNTTILISPAGGVSMVAPFLPHGSHAILMDYYVTGENSFGFRNGSSASMEGMFLNHFPHFKKDYYQVYGKQDYVFDFSGTNDTRNHASIIINLTRLQLLIESALQDIGL